MTNPVSDAFSSNYRDARGKFVRAADKAQLPVSSQIHPLRGKDDEELALDVVRDGPSDASRVLLISSACHGVEGYCGSGIQVDLLSDPKWRAAAADAGVAVVYAHALNPWGFSWLRRTTHENVDINRNVHDFTQALPANAGYEALADSIVPTQWPAEQGARDALAKYASVHGAMALQQAITGGQHSHPDGLFFGGHSPTWSQSAVRQMLREQCGSCAELGWIDIHTGLGPRGHGELILASALESLPRAQSIWGKVTSFQDGSSSSAPLTGLIWLTVPQEAPQAQYTGIALEFGVVPLDQTLDALRGDQWLHKNPDAPDPKRVLIKDTLSDAFFGQDEDWQRQILQQGRAAAMAFLAS